MKLAVWVGLLLCLVGTAEARSAKIVATVSKYNQAALEGQEAVLYVPRRPGVYRAAATIECNSWEGTGELATLDVRVKESGRSLSSVWYASGAQSTELPPVYVKAGDTVVYAAVIRGAVCHYWVALEDVFDTLAIPPPPPSTTTTTLP